MPRIKDLTPYKGLIKARKYHVKQYDETII